MVTTLIISQNFSNIYKGYKYLLTKKIELEQDQLSNCVNCFDLSFKASILGGTLGFIIGLALLIKNWPDKSAIGPGVSLLIIACIYGLFFGFYIFSVLLCLSGYFIQVQAPELQKTDR